MLRRPGHWSGTLSPAMDPKFSIIRLNARAVLYISDNPLLQIIVVVVILTTIVVIITTIVGVVTTTNFTLSLDKD